MSKLIGNVLLAAASIILTLLALEIVFRMIPAAANTALSWVDRPEYYYDPAGAKNHTGQTHSPVKPPNTFRVAVVGDSYSFGPFIQYDDTFAARLGRILNLNRTELRAEVINYGIPGYSTSHEIDLVKRALDEGADLVILQMTLNDAEAKPYRPPGVIASTNPYGAIVLSPDSGWFVARSKLLSFVAERRFTYGSKRRYRDYFFGLYEETKSGFRLFTRSLAAIQKLCRERNVPLTAAIFPLFGANIDSTYEFDALHQKIGELLQQSNIVYTDLTKKYFNIPSARLQVIPGQDFHPNEIAHRIAAEALYSWLAAQNLIPEPLKIKTVYRFRHHVEPTSEDLEYAGP